MTFTLFATRKQEIGNEIATIQSQITLLQQQLADQQAFLQEIGTVEQAGESAISQTMTFLTMVRAIDPSQEAVFWQTVEALKNSDIEALAPVTEVSDIDDKTQATSASPAPAADTLEVTAVEVVEEAETTPDATPAEDISSMPEITKEDEADKPAQNDDRLLTYAELTRVSWSDMKKICSDRSIANPSGQRLTRKFAETALMNNLRVADITHLVNYDTIIAI